MKCSGASCPAFIQALSRQFSATQSFTVIAIDHQSLGSIPRNPIQDLLAISDHTEFDSLGVERYDRSKESYVYESHSDPASARLFSAPPSPLPFAHSSLFALSLFPFRHTSLSTAPFSTECLPLADFKPALVKRRRFPTQPRGTHPPTQLSLHPDSPLLET